MERPPAPWVDAPGEGQHRSHRIRPAENHGEHRRQQVSEAECQAPWLASWGAWTPFSAVLLATYTLPRVSTCAPSRSIAAALGDGEAGLRRQRLARGAFPDLRDAADGRDPA